MVLLTGPSILYPVVSAHPLARPWLELTGLRGRSAQTMDAYGRDLAAFLEFATEIDVDVTHVIGEHAAMYIGHMRSLPRAAAQLCAPRLPQRPRQRDDAAPPRDGAALLRVILT